ncbi:chaplin [Streptomyces sp. URMC 124]|uniref:chaplin n=1 Tax=Streptomyces sp. URMC 124 TaxID=3423405 RepID=UPI003F1B85A2
MSRIVKTAALTATVGAALAGLTGHALADAGAKGVAAGSPGVISGNVIQVPIHIPINLCGNTIDIVGLLNPASGNVCINSSGGHGHGGHGGYGHGGYGH